MKLHFLFVVSLCSLLVLASGCGGGGQSLKGKITFEDDGSPLTAGMVCFTTGTAESRGVIQPDGTYVIGTNTDRDGIPPGEYRVYIINAVEVTGYDEANAMDITRPLIHAKYGSPDTSGLTHKTGEKTFDFKVERPQAR